MECARWNSSSPLKAESICVELLAEATDAPKSVLRKPPYWLRTACELLQDCPGETPRIREVAKAVGVHPAHLARAFRTFLACTPGDLLRARRLELAAALMNSDRSLVEIALDSGFSDQAQLTKAFRRTYGIPPGAYRHFNLRRSRHVAI
jgi:AraC family transcriptional regulator